MHRSLRRSFPALIAGFFMLAALASVATADDYPEHRRAQTDENVRYLADGSVEIDTEDPAGNKVTVVIDPKIRNAVNHPWDDPADPLFRGFEVEELEQFPEEAARATTVPVYVVADEEYRAQYSDWTSRTYNIVETADNAYYRDFSINWVIQGYYSWTSNGSNSSQILADLANDGSGLPDGLVIGFTRDSNFDAGGIAYVYGSNPGTGYSVTLDQGSSSTTYALRHEIGHNYGASHDFGGTVCMMNYTYAYSVDYFDSAHDSLVSSHSGWF